MRQRGDTPDRRAPRAGRRADGAGLQPAAAEAERLHGGERPRRDQSDDRRRQRADRLRPGRGDRRLERHQAVRQAGVPGNRPARDHEGLHQVGRPRRQSEADSRDGEYGLPEGDGRQARAGLSRFSGRYPLRQDPGGPGRLEPERPRAAQPAADGRARARRRADRCALQGEAADHTHRQRRHLVAGVDRAAVLRGEGGHTLLHDAARPRRAARRSSAVLPHHALLGVQGCRPHSDHRHAHELHHRPRRAAALCRQRHDCADRHRCG